MSLSMKNLVNRKATNRTVQSNNRLVDFVTPPITSRNLVVHKDLIVEKDSYLNGNVTFGGDVSVAGNVSVTGTLLASTFLPGQVIHVSMLSADDLGQSSPMTINAGNSGAASDVFSYTYTPTTNNSYIIYEYYSSYTVGGSNGDTIYANLYVKDGSLPVEYISSSSQHWDNSQGGGTRSSVLFPIVGRYTNDSLSPKTVVLNLDMIHGNNDNITITAGNSMWLKITEIGR